MTRLRYIEEIDRDTLIDEMREYTLEIMSDERILHEFMAAVQMYICL